MPLNPSSLIAFNIDKLTTAKLSARATSCAGALNYHLKISVRKAAERSVLFMYYYAGVLIACRLFGKSYRLRLS